MAQKMFTYQILLLLCFSAWCSALEGSFTLSISPSRRDTCRRRPQTTSTFLEPEPTHIHSFDAFSSSASVISSQLEEATSASTTVSGVVQSAPSNVNPVVWDYQSATFSSLESSYSPDVPLAASSSSTSDLSQSTSLSLDSSTTSYWAISDSISSTSNWAISTSSSASAATESGHSTSSSESISITNSQTSLSSSGDHTPSSTSQLISSSVEDVLSSTSSQYSYASATSTTVDTLIAASYSQLVTTTSSATLPVLTASSVSLPSSSSTASSLLIPAANNDPAITVSTDGTKDYTSIGDAITYAQSRGYSTVNVLAGTYVENITVSNTAAVTIVGETSDSAGFSGNLVTVYNGGNTATTLNYAVAAKGITWKNVNFLNTNASSAAGAVYLRGSKNAFYSCKFIASGQVAINGAYASAIIANSYIEATDKVVYSYPSLYIYGSTITATSSSANLVYNKGGTYTSGTTSTLYNSTIVFDSCSVVQKAGVTNSNVFLAAANAAGSVVLYRDSALAGFIAASGAHVDATTQDTRNKYIEFGTTGTGSYLNKASVRSQYVSWVTDVTQLSVYDISNFFATAYPSVAHDLNCLINDNELNNLVSAQLLNFLVFDRDRVTITCVFKCVFSNVFLRLCALGKYVFKCIFNNGVLGFYILALCVFDFGVVHSPDFNSNKLYFRIGLGFFDVSPSLDAKYCVDTIAALPADSSTQYIYILAGTYTEQVTLSRTGTTIIRGETSNSWSSSSNMVTIQNKAGVSSSAGGSSGTAVFSASKYEAKLVSFYNVNFENTYTPTTNYVALGVYAKGKQVAFYGCNIKSSQGTLYFDYGAFFFSGGRIQGTTDFIWGQGAAYIYNSVIVSSGTSTGQTIAAHKYQGSYGRSQFVFDTCAMVPADNLVPTGSTYLGRDYSTNSSVAVVNSYLDSHIAAARWKISAASTFVGTFVESNNTGPASSVARVRAVADGSVYTVANVLGDDSWLDTSAIAPFSGWPDSIYTQASTTSSTVAPATVTNSASSTASVSTSSVASTLTVAPTPTVGQYGSVASAIAALPSDGLAYTIYILAGTYEEQFNVTRRGKVTLRGETTWANDFTRNTVLIQFSDGVSTSANANEQTPIINWKNTNADGLALYNINFTNTYPQTPSTAALAADFYGTNMAAYGCAFKGFQDSLLVNQGVQVFSNSYVEGSVDFIWGYSKAYFHQCYIASNTANAYITAQNRPSASWAGGFVFDRSVITYTPSYGTTYSSTYLGRPWSQYAIVVYMNSFLDQHIAAAGWSTWATSDPRTTNVLFGEFNNTGAGNWTSSRASFATQLTESQASSYSLTSFIGSTSWLDMAAFNYAPSYSLSSGASATTSPSNQTTPTVTWTHPTSGTSPPAGAVLVSVNGIIPGSYTSLTDALASLPADTTTQVIFMYPGTYNEQPPAVNRAGPVIIMGYTSDAPGRAYKTNQVTITQARGLSVSPVPVGHSNAETATFSTASSKISMYNINLVNSDNSDGSKASYVTLAGSIYGNKIGFYGCSFVGWQDTLLTGATNGYQYYESCYIEGAIDFIWGYSKAYFKGCTIGAKKAKSAVTAHSRSSLSAIGGYIFDQCLFTAAEGFTTDLTGTVYLGRPYSKYALVVVKNSYLDNTIQPAGWKVWSSTDPRTDYITFAEYNNAGPGNWENNVAARQAFGNSTLLTSDTYSLATVMDSTDWIDMTYWDSIVTPTPSVTNTTSPVTPVANTTTPYDGTNPPAGAFIVSKTAIQGITTYDTIQSALDALPTSSSAKATIFIYPGVYEEQLIVKKSGTTTLLGYSASPGDYSQNQVTITYNKGIDTQADASNSDSATVYATGNFLQAVNINFANTFGNTQNYASLGFGVKSSKYASLYGCQVFGGQDALLINGYFFASNSYIEGNIDMIWGSGAGYFLNSTIAPNKDGIALTANKRTNSTTAAGFVFDQCTVKPAASASYSAISLGRPWNQYARVAYINSYLDSCIEATGWDYWTKTDPRTSGVLFGEAGNYGPGASTASRASFATQLDASTAAQFQLSSFFTSTSWINTTYVWATPFAASSVPSPISSSASISSISSTSASTSTVFTTFYTTSVSTLKQTAYTTVTAADKTVSNKVTNTLDVGTTITPDPVSKTVLITITTSIQNTATEPDTVETVKSTVIVDVGTTVTPNPTTKTDTSVITVTSTDIATTTAKAVTVKSTLTETAYATSTPKASTTTQVVGSTVTSTKTSTQQAVTTILTITVTSGSEDATTTSAKATTTWVTSVTTTTKTVKSTTTLSCTPTSSIKRRGREEAFLQARDAIVKTVTVTVPSLYTTTVATATSTVSGTTVTTDIVTTRTVGKTSTLKPVTNTETSSVTVFKTSTTTVPGSTLTTTSLATKTTGKTSVLKASTVVVTGVTTTTQIVKSTITLPAQTITSLATSVRTITTVLPASTHTVTSTKNVSETQIVTLEASTVTKTSTAKTTLHPSTTITQRATVTKTTTVKSTTYTTSVATSIKKNSPTCAA
ncbi:hypothetical protein JX265_010407 [Neoarthrinium moseri]|uniref:pectinesterase n=1 Tax=Neoarthrinium moseri TaxID=1658444 RepID=A0A9P9WEG8_9PEZI|nr:hypothetical protein JX265_010407 [Neoarthrinium moseri]